MNATKPIPDDIIHTFPDDGLVSLMKLYQDLVNKSSDDLEINYLQTRIEDIYKVMGYRCALDYINRKTNGD